MELTRAGQQLHLHPHRAIFWEDQRTLLIADLHLGKAAHFRKQGLAAPAQVLTTNLRKLRELLEFYSPERVLFLGDLFHSQLNKVWEAFTLFLDDYPEISFELVKGNHDILPEAAYKASIMRIHPDTLVIGPFIFSHYPLEGQFAGYNFYGHLHPGVLLSGAGQEQLKLPCFHFGARQAVLPAFGAFTGLAMVRLQAGDRVFVIAEETVVEVSS